MSEESKYLKLARTAREEDNGEDAKNFYNMVRTDDPENAEAKFFYQYYSLYEGKNGEIPDRFSKLLNSLDTSLKYIAQSKDSEEEKLKLLKDIVNAFTPMTWSLNRYMNTLFVGSGQNRSRVFSNTEIKNTSTSGVIALNKLGDSIEKMFNGNPEAMKIAATAWKESVSLRQKWYAFKFEGQTPEEIAAKIQKVDSSYEMPKKAGCISFANSKN